MWLVERYGETQRFRLQMRPGLTGPMQVHGRGELNFQERLAVEREYVENYSLRKDLKILLRTVSIIWRGPGTRAAQRKLTSTRSPSSSSRSRSRRASGRTGGAERLGRQTWTSRAPSRRS